MVGNVVDDTVGHPVDVSEQLRTACREADGNYKPAGVTIPNPIAAILNDDEKRPLEDRRENKVVDVSQEANVVRVDLFCNGGGYEVGG